MLPAERVKNLSYDISTQKHILWVNIATIYVFEQK